MVADDGAAFGIGHAEHELGVLHWQLKTAKAELAEILGLPGGSDEE